MKQEIEKWFDNELINEMFPKTSKEFWQYYATQFQQEYDNRIFEFNRLLAVSDEMLGNLKRNADLLEKYEIDLMNNPTSLYKDGQVWAYRGNATLSEAEFEQGQQLWDYYAEFYGVDMQVNDAIIKVEEIRDFLHNLYGDLQQADVLDNPEYAALVDMYLVISTDEQEPIADE